MKAIIIILAFGVFGNMKMLMTIDIKEHGIYKFKIDLYNYKWFNSLIYTICHYLSSLLNSD